MAHDSSTILYKMFEDFLEMEDFVGADLVRKFLQMGYTRALGYGNYQKGTKYDKNKDFALNEKSAGNSVKAQSAAIFYQKWKQAEAHPQYASRKKAWREQYG